MKTENRESLGIFLTLKCMYTVHLCLCMLQIKTDIIIIIMFCLLTVATISLVAMSTSLSLSSRLTCWGGERLRVLLGFPTTLTGIFLKKWGGERVNIIHTVRNKCNKAKHWHIDPQTPINLFLVPYNGAPVNLSQANIFAQLVSCNAENVSIWISLW